MQKQKKEESQLADKTKTIKTATDKELDELIWRLRKENEVQNLIGDIKRKSMPNGFTSYDRPEISTEEPIESLYHRGVLGMRWGRRTASIATSKPKPNSDSPDNKKKDGLMKKKINSMSNTELKSLNERLQLERSYKELTKKQVSPGRKFVNTILSDVGTTQVKKIANELAGKGTDKLLASILKTAAKKVV